MKLPLKRGPELPDAPLVRWCEPKDFAEELVLSGRLELEIATLARELRYVDRFLRAKVDAPTRILFGGPSGTGKTLAAKWLGYTLQLPVAIVDVSATVSKWVGETAKNVAEAFRLATSTSAILFLDEIDAVCAVRADSDSGASKELARATTTTLQQLDWLGPKQLVIAATNFPDDLDSALARRFNTHVTFELPDAGARRRMLASWLSCVRVGADTLDRLTDEGDGMSGAQLRSLAMAHARRLIMREIDDEPPPPPPPPPRPQSAFAQEMLQHLESLGPKP